MKKYLWAIISTVIIVPAIAFSWHNIQKIWAAPQKIETVEEAVKENAMIQRQLTDISQRQQTQIEVHDAELKHEKEIRQTEKEFYLELIKQVKE